MPIRLAGLPLVADPGDASGRKFRFNPLNADMRLFRRPRAEDDITHLSEPINVPEPLSVRLMALAVKAAQASTNPAPDDVVEDDYGAGESIQLWRQTGSNLPVPAAAIRICDLRDILDSSNNVIGWNHEATIQAGTIGVDPERGRVLLGSIADGPLEAAFHYGTPSPIGGGDYERTPPGLDLFQQETVVNSAALQPKLNLIKAGGRLLIMDSRTYPGTPTFKVDAVTATGQPGHEVVVAAMTSFRPLIEATGTMILDVRQRGRLEINGLVISGGMLHLAAAADGETRELVLRHCTLVPGRTLNTDGSANSPGAVSLRVDHPFAKVTLIDCITGPLVMAPDVDVEIKNCVIDAGAPDRVAYAGAPAGGPGGTLIVRESTIIGKLHARSIKLASNSIFFASRRLPPASDSWAAPVIVERRQQGCLRFCFVPVGSITPRRYRCVPDGEHPDAIPQFTSLRYGDPAYCQLRGVTDRSIRMGADDESEMGVLHDLYQPQREANLRIRLEEYLRFGLRAGIFYAT